jgi:hypothetical protein
MRTDPTTDRLRVLAAIGLSDHGRVPDRPVDAEQWPALLAGARRERLDALLAWSIADGVWPATPVQRAEAYESHRRSMAAALVLERALIDLAALFDGAALDFRLLKGPALAHLDELDPTLRPFGDLDLLVPADQIGRAVELLVSRGGMRRYPEPRPGFDQRFSKGMCIVVPAGHEIDLHRTLCPGPFGLTIDLAELFAGTEPIALGNRTIPALDRPRRFVHACLHAILGSPSPRPAQLRDVARTCPTDAGQLAAAFALAESWRASIVVAHSVRVVADVLHWRPPEGLQAWVESLRPRRVERRWLGAYVGPNRSSIAQTIGAVSAVRGPRAKLAYSTAVVLPRRGQSTRSRAERARRGLRTLRRRVSP